MSLVLWTDGRDGLVERAKAKTAARRHFTNPAPAGSLRDRHDLLGMTATPLCPVQASGQFRDLRARAVEHVGIAALLGGKRSGMGRFAGPADCPNGRSSSTAWSLCKVR